MFQEIAPSDEDIDVTNERQRVDVQSDDVIIVRGMRKVYPVGKKDVKVFYYIYYILFFMGTNNVV